MNTYICARCKKVFWEDEMSSSKFVYCKHCMAEIAREWRRDNPERFRRNSRRYYGNNKEALLKHQKEQRLTNPEIRRAHDHTYQANLDRKPCEMCSNPTTQAHHDNYSNPLDVRWLCRSCHQRLHYERRQQLAKTIC